MSFNALSERKSCAQPRGQDFDVEPRLGGFVVFALAMHSLRDSASRVLHARQ